MKINKITSQFNQVCVSYGENNLQIDYNDYILKQWIPENNFTDYYPSNLNSSLICCVYISIMTQRFCNSVSFISHWKQGHFDVLKLWHIIYNMKYYDVKGGRWTSSLLIPFVSNLWKFDEKRPNMQKNASCICTFFFLLKSTTH